MSLVDLAAALRAIEPGSDRNTHARLVRLGGALRGPQDNPTARREAADLIAALAGVISEVEP